MGTRGIKIVDLREGQRERESNEKDNLRQGPIMRLARNCFQGNSQKSTITPAKTPRYSGEGA